MHLVMGVPIADCRLPIYPPEYMAVSVGMHPKRLRQVPELIRISPTTELQVLILPEDVPPSKYIKVRLADSMIRP